jgi:TolB-like protein/DNA-binding winged helix-turn-helix (wHTH) protein
MGSPVRRFGSFEFSPETGELRQEGRRINLQPQPARLLDLLLARPGALVTRDEIRQALWGIDTHVDFERSLNFCVAKLRSALGDNAAAPAFIETVPTRGYRFIAATATATEYTEYKKSESEPTRGPRTGPWHSPYSVYSVYSAALALVILTGFGVYAFWPASQPPRIVVVPFHNETASPDFDRVAKGVSDAAVARLATPERLPRLLVIGNAANLQFSFKPRDMKAVGDSLGAQYLLLGQLKRDDRRMRVVAHLIRVSDQTHLWARTFDSEALDLDRQSAIAEEIASAITSTLSAKH